MLVGRPGNHRMLSSAVDPYACSSCPIGFFEDSATVTANLLTNTKASPNIECTTCPTGWYQNTKSSALCLACTPGRFSEGIEKKCTACAKGKYQTAQFMTECKSCPGGYSQAKTGQEGCEDCPIGKYEETESKAECKECASGQFQDKLKQLECKRETECPRGTVPNALKSGCEKPLFVLAFDCKRDLEYLDDSSPNRMNHSCKDCPEGSNCNRLQPLDEQPKLSTLQPLDGFYAFEWASKFNPYAKCPYPGACENGACVRGNEGVLCAICSPNFIQDTDKCTECTQEKVTEKIGFAIGLLVLLLIFFACWQTKLKSCRKKYGAMWRDVLQVFSIEISFAQIGNSLEMSMDVPWPSAYTSWMKNLGFANFDLLSMLGM